jgi:hypothetical protein
MSTPEQGRTPIADGTDIKVELGDIESDEAPETSAAEAYREDSDALGGTGGKDAGGAG